MGIHVAFQPPAYGGSPHVAFCGNARASEAVADGATGSLTANDGEIAIVHNTGSAVSYVAHGSTPDSAATTSTAATSARYAIGAGETRAFSVKTGDKFASAAS
jgi:hypothetical protein